MDQQQAVQEVLPSHVSSRRQPPPVVESRRRWIQLGTPGDFEWNRYELPIPALPPQLDGLRIAHITDLHIRKSWRGLFDRLIERVRAESPDLILITGDFVDHKRHHDPAVPHARRLLAELKAPLGCFGTLGNHDRYQLEPKLAGSGVVIIEKRRHVIEVDGAELELIGLPGVDRHDLTPQVLESFPQRRSGVPRIILSHYPDHLRQAVSLMPDIFLAGHTHGGQVCLPGGTPIRRNDSLPRRLCSGVNRVANTWLVVSRGLGYTDLPIRLFCPPELIEITLRR